MAQYYKILHNAQQKKALHCLLRKNRKHNVRIVEGLKFVEHGKRKAYCKDCGGSHLKSHENNNTNLIKKFLHTFSYISV